MRGLNLPIDVHLRLPNFNPTVVRLLLRRRPPTGPHPPRLQRPQGQTRRHTTGGPNPPPSNPTPNSSPSPSSSPQQSATKATAAAERIIARLPAPLRRYASRLRGAPATHVVAFLALHEVTAVVPLAGLFALFHYSPQLAPASYLLDHYGGYVRDGAARFERYFRRKGWFGFGGGEGGGAGEEAGKEEGEGEGGVMELWRRGESKYRVVVEVALAYAVTKALLPVRIVVSLWATPWFAGMLIRVGGLWRRARR